MGSVAGTCGLHFVLAGLRSETIGLAQGGQTLNLQASADRKVGGGDVSRSLSRLSRWS
jgi:hypothetical protein